MNRVQLEVLVALAVVVPPVWVGGLSQLAELATWAVLLGVVFAVVMAAAVHTRNAPMTAGQWVVARKGGALKAGPIPDHLKTPSRHQTARHEAGHAACADQGGKSWKSVIYDEGGGFCAIKSWWKDPIDNMAFLYGGQRAVNSQRGCSHDNALIAEFANQIPAAHRAAACAEAKRRADKHLSNTSGMRSRVADTLFHRGWCNS